MGQAARTKKYFTVAEANAALPLVRAIAGDLTTLAAELRDRRKQLGRLQARRRPERGDVFSEELEQTLRDLADEENRLEEYTEELAGLGVETEAAAEGLYVFPSRQAGRDILLCWKLGEPRVAHWHAPGEGRFERRPLESAPTDDFPAGLAPPP